jgi:hypothetical protein
MPTIMVRLTGTEETGMTTPRKTLARTATTAATTTASQQQ